MNNLKQYRKLAKWTTAEAAQACLGSKASQGNYSKYERGILNPRAATRINIFNGFKKAFPGLKFNELWGDGMEADKIERAAAATATRTEQKPLKDIKSRQLITGAASTLSFIPAKNATLTMSTREIAELCGKHHKNVTRDFEGLCSELCINKLNFERIYFDTMNREQTEYLLTKELSITLVSGYDVRMRHIIIKRWLELEAQQRPAPQPKPVALPTVKELAQMVIEAEEEKERLQLENKQKDEKINVLNNRFYAGMTIPDFCRGLHGININKVQNYLVEKGWLFKTGRKGEFKTTSYSRSQRGYLVEKFEHRYKESKFPVHFAVLTNKGAAKLIDMYTRGELAAVMLKGWDKTRLTHDYYDGEVA